MRNPLSSPEILALIEMCLDAEDRCAERAAEARERGDDAALERERLVKARYARLRHRISGQTHAVAGRSFPDSKRDGIQPDAANDIGEYMPHVRALNFNPERAEGA